jgi:chromosome segregation protein
MYLKTLEIVGFKSFADKTVLSFEPGMTAIVGPNGCGKSNVADCLRWVLGEQSAKALRGSQMVDCIFNGTDDRKPLGMAEVSVTFTDCEQVLNTEYNEITITRRVFRSGEGQYFINKTPCRLKDINRLFMDTGVGTTSYSMMEQGRIDAILSARPEDRRAIFEEASGIMKFKSDKKEAIRKLEHTEANLLRLSDVIREVKRQIGSLQRQAGKARRYKSQQEELRKLDIYSTKQRLTEADRVISELSARLESMTVRQNTLRGDIREHEARASQQRGQLMQTERDIGAVIESGVKAKSNLDHTHEMIELNRQRISEYESLSNRDEGEIVHSREQLAQIKSTMRDQEARISEAGSEKEAAENEYNAEAKVLSEYKDRVDALRSQIQELRDESVELESLSSRLQNEMVELQSRERTNLIQKEKLAAEKSQLNRVVEAYAHREDIAGGEIAALSESARENESKAQNLDTARDEVMSRRQLLVNECSALEQQAASGNARLELLVGSSDGEEAGARRGLDKASTLEAQPGDILGDLSSRMEVEPDYIRAIEAALKSWLSAVLIKDTSTAMTMLDHALSRHLGPIQLLPLDVAAQKAILLPSGDRLLDHVTCEDDVRRVLEQFIGRFLVVDDFSGPPPPPQVSYVTRDGRILHASGAIELWSQENDAASPLTRKSMIETQRSELKATESQIATIKGRRDSESRRLEEIENDIAAHRATLESSRRSLAQKEGEFQVVSGETNEARSRLETVTWESEELNRQDDSEHGQETEITRRLNELREQRERLSLTVAERARELHELESRQMDLQSRVTELRVLFEGLSHRLENFAGQLENTQTREKDLELAVKGRTETIESHTAHVQRLAETVATAQQQLGSMESTVTAENEKADSLQNKREELEAEIRSMDEILAGKRSALEESGEARSEAEVQLTEARMRRQNQVERVTSEYNLSVENFDAEPAPEWKDDEIPDLDSMETTIAELRTKLDAMGPVNLVAIEEYKELEERYAFLTEQEEDLVKSKQQLMDMIRKINRTTSEMFQSTFEQVNENFLNTFSRLFNGGTAKLVLVNEEDVLECGIEIIARPPGKRLQNVSLLSGGERTLTAVSLLFAIYMIKPSPFCVLDELDAALDDTNIGRFVDILQSFLDQSQFVIITHNRATIAAAHILYGVTMPERGISKIVSMRFSEGRTVPAKASAVAPSAPLEAR